MLRDFQGCVIALTILFCSVRAKCAVLSLLRKQTTIYCKSGAWAYCLLFCWKDDLKASDATLPFTLLSRVPVPSLTLLLTCCSAHVTLGVSNHTRKCNSRLLQSRTCWNSLSSSIMWTFSLYFTVYWVVQPVLQYHKLVLCWHNVFLCCYSAAWSACWSGVGHSTVRSTNTTTPTLGCIGSQFSSLPP